VRNATGSNAFELEVKTGPVASVDECTMQRIEACVRYKLPDQTSNMAVLEVHMVTGYVPDRASLDQLSHQPDTSKCATLIYDCDKTATGNWLKLCVDL
jgi:hypothetical protein